MPANTDLRSYDDPKPAPPVRNQSPPMQTHNPTDDAKKACKCRPSRERLKGFEPSTFGCEPQRACKQWGIFTRLRPARCLGFTPIYGSFRTD
jgi:hypothetical protein